MFIWGSNTQQQNILTVTYWTSLGTIEIANVAVSDICVHQVLQAYHNLSYQKALFFLLLIQTGDWLVLAKVPWYCKWYLWGQKQEILLWQPVFQLMYKSPEKDMPFECDACESLPHTLHKRSLGLDDKDLEVVCSFYLPHWSTFPELISPQDKIFCCYDNLPVKSFLCQFPSQHLYPGKPLPVLCRFV